jgi:hypothetical protein
MALAAFSEALPLAACRKFALSCCGFFPPVLVACRFFASFASTSSNFSASMARWPEVKTTTTETTIMTHDKGTDAPILPEYTFAELAELTPQQIDALRERAGRLEALLVHRGDPDMAVQLAALEEEGTHSTDRERDM